MPEHDLELAAQSLEHHFVRAPVGDRTDEALLEDVIKFEDEGVGGDMFSALAVAGDLIRDGRLVIPIDTVYPLAEAAAAQADSQAGHTRGRRVLVP